MAELAIIAGLSLAGAIALGLPIRLFGWRPVWDAFRAVLRFARRHRWTALLILLVGAIAGLWTFDSVRSLLFGVVFR
ncbi:MAG: hypothetical protein ACOC05_09995 [Oceanicaulis sp.]